MIQPSSENHITVIIAHRGSDRHLADAFLDLKLWFSDITIVGPSYAAILEEIKTRGGNWIDSESSGICELWEKGIRSKSSSWYLLLESREYLSTILKESIVETSNSAPVRRTWFPIEREIFLLKQRLKYPLEWTHDPRPGLLFTGTERMIRIDQVPSSGKELLEGKSIYFAENTVGEVIINTMHRAEQVADQLYRTNPSLSPFTLVSSALKTSLSNFVRNWILRKGMREGFEGWVFSMLDLMAVILGHLRHYEKYFRGGKRIADNLTSIHNILVIKLGGAGDVILVTPILRNLKKLLPNAHIHVLVLREVASLLENNPYVDSITHMDFDSDKKTINKISRGFKNNTIDLAINLQSTNFSSKVLKIIPARWKINRSYFYRDKSTNVLVGFTNTFRSAIERDLDILRSIGLKPVDKHSEVFLSTKEIDWAKNFFSSSGLSHEKKILIVHPCSSLKIRNWGIEKFALLCRNLIAGGDIQIIINCSPQETDSISPIKTLAPEVRVFSGSLRELLGLINESDLFIGNDSGPSHFSAALNVPTITLNGPSTSSFMRDPDLYRDPHYTFNKDVPCRDLFHSQCMTKIDPITNHPSCDEMICLDFSVDEVTDKVRELIRR